MDTLPDLPAVLAGDPRFLALALLCEQQLADIDPQGVVVRWIDRVHSSLLPILAEELSLLDDGWELAETESDQRALLKIAVRLHQLKGTPASIEAVFDAVGLGEVQIDEGTGGRYYDGSMSYDGFASYDDPDGWAIYRVRLSRILTTRQAEIVRRILANIAPAHCHLWGLDFTGSELIYNGAACYDGSYTHGVA